VVAWPHDILIGQPATQAATLARRRCKQMILTKNSLLSYFAPPSSQLILLMGVLGSSPFKKAIIKDNSLKKNLDFSTIHLF
jgi:hypothetical protein